jgi:hypothetical protein
MPNYNRTEKNKENLEWCMTQVAIIKDQLLEVTEVQWGLENKLKKISTVLDEVDLDINYLEE